MRQQPSNTIRGIVLKILYVLTVATMLTLIKSIDELPIWELMFFRSFLSIAPVAVYFAYRGELAGAVQTKRPLAHLTRTLLGVTTMALTFVAVRALPLPEAITLQYTQPLFVVALSAMLLREPVRYFRWAAVGFGFLGVLVITWPRLTLLTAPEVVMSQVQIIGAIAALTAAATLAINLLMMETLVVTEKSSTMVIWFWIYSSLILACTLPFGWIMPTPNQFAVLVLAGFLGGVAQMLMGECLRCAPAATTAPFEYTSLIFVTVLSYFMFGYLPDLHTVIGGAFVVAAGLAILWRERRLGKLIATQQQRPLCGD